MQRLELDKDGKVVLTADNVRIDCNGKLDADTLKSIAGGFTCSSEAAVRILGQQIGLSIISCERWGMIIYSNDELSKGLRKQLDCAEELSKDLNKQLDRANQKINEQECDIINLNEKLVSYHYNWAVRILKKLHIL